MTKLHQLFEEQGQSPWIDNLKRSYLTTGELQRLVTEGIRGVTSNPTIFQRAIEGSADYDDEFSRLIGQGSVEDAYWTMVANDVTNALAVLRPVHDATAGTDGFVSLEVAPRLAADTDATIEAARDLHQRIDRPNLMVKIPATREGVPAIRTMISEGRNINVTLIFSLSRYGDVIEAYLSGLEALVAAGGDPSKVHSVASFFVSRVDTEVDRRLDQLGELGAGLGGRAALAQAKLAYRLFEERFSGPRWTALSDRGAHRQRPLWASTSTKNPAYPDLLYVDNLIGPDTVNTMPDATVEAFIDHGILARTVDHGVSDARAHLDALAAVGIDMGDVAQVLEDEGVAAFSKSFDELMQALTDKAATLAGRPH
ncbi:MAG TPA: transaldolase, partial [Acidimicrobiales bacterium]|nr:transaldolase [Acidimicrobiales bacterium]